MAKCVACGSETSGRLCGPCANAAAKAARELQDRANRIAAQERKLAEERKQRDQRNAERDKKKK